MINFTTVLLVAVLFLSVVQGVRYELIHNLGDDGGYISRGSVTVVQGSNAIRLSQEELTDRELEALDALVKEDEYYLLSLCPEGVTTKQDGCVSTFIQACRVQQGGLADVLSFYLTGRGEVMGFNVYMPKSGYCSGPSSVRPKAVYEFSTKTTIQVPSTAPAPDTQTYIQKMEEMKKKKATGQTEDNRSFLAKYWMYLVPVFIFLAVSSSQDSSGGGGS